MLNAYIAKHIDCVIIVFPGSHFRGVVFSKIVSPHKKMNQTCQDAVKIGDRTWEKGPCRANNDFSV